MTYEVNKEQIASIRSYLNVMNAGNFEHLKEFSLETLDRLEKQLPQVDNYALKFGEYIQDRLCGEDWFLLNKTVEELYEEFKKQQ